MNCRTSKQFVLLCSFLVFCAALAGAQVAPTSEFQLDGTAALNPAYPACLYGQCDYWNLLNGSGTGGANPGGSAGSSAARTFANGETTTLAFIGGGSKDPNDLTSWSCTSKSSPNKDTLTNGYAAAYANNPATDLIFVFGADRLSTSGDANIGIWFFQESVACNTATGKFVQPNGTPATHTPGDIFAVSAFTVGGTVPTITVYMWNPACLSPGNPAGCADTNLQLLFSVTAACDGSSGVNTSAACAITNSASIQSSWPYPTAGSTVPSTIPAQAFFTGGIDISYLLQHFGGISNTPCFSSFLEETRSSQTTSAVLKDFLGGNFNLCSIGITKECSTGAGAPQIINNGTDVQYTYDGLITNTGIGTVTNVTLNDPTPSGATFVSQTGPSSTTLKAGQSATYSIVFDSTNTTLTNNATATAMVGGQTINSTGPPASATCNISVSSVIAIKKHCASPGLSNLTCSSNGCVVTVPITSNVCNNGNTELTNIQIADNPATLAAITPNGFTLTPGECTGTTSTTACTSNSQCAGSDTCVSGFCTAPANPSGTFQPTSFDPNSTGNSGGRFLFDDTIRVTGATPALGPPIPPVQGCPGGSDLACSAVACPLCPQGECSTVPLP